MTHLSMKLKAMWGLLLMLCLLRVALCDDTSIENRCGNEITKLTNCLDFATGKTSEPAGSCCGSVSDIRQRDAVCLCFIVQQTHDGSPGFKSLGLQFPRMLALPGDCKIANSSITECPSKNSTTNSPASRSFNLKLLLLLPQTTLHNMSSLTRLLCNDLE
ncbi:non-specific lipid transfer protein GPI-anchored 1-like [Ananas comosus]|uniref:Non-specific lipid transfer protein GPI-anchored 1-like n=2 Tax=Ananas comosus TaxID=4615 RepID=A0A6P5GZ07_ANACO|nr:non-specific lipid transfer protein GPI-anchored 1-like [Ananas comosus]